MEPYRYRLVSHTLEAERLRMRISVLHISDTHLKSNKRKLVAFLRHLPQELGMVPDLVLATGDLIEDDSGIDPIVDVLGGLEGRLGRFYVRGAHDYYQSTFESYTKYLRGQRSDLGAKPADTRRLEDGLIANGWRPLTNTAEVLETRDGVIRLAGVDDPYLNRHRTGHIKRSVDDRLAIGLVHSPDVVSEWALAGFDLVVAGHTHAGQVRAPFIGALVTNCSLPAALAGGPHRVGTAWLHVSPGLGTGRFSPIRFNASPEATLLHLVGPD